MLIQLPAPESKEMMAFVDRRHPAFYECYEHWRFCEETFEGGRHWFAENIHMYIKEGTREFGDRIRRAYRFNHTREVVQLVTKYIFKQGVIRNTTDATDSIKRFWKHATLDGTAIDDYMKQISNASSVNGRVWVVVDSRTPEGVVTKADEKNGKTRVYSYLVKQEDVLDFAQDEYGKLEWILYRIKHRDDSDPIKSTGNVKNRFMLWTREEFILLEEQFKNPGNQITPSVQVVTNPDNAGVFATALVNGIVALQNQTNLEDSNQREIVTINRGVNPIGEVPVFQADHMNSGKIYNPPGLVDEIVYLDRAVANYLSNLDAVIQDQTFSQLAMPAQGLMPGEENYNKMVEMGTKRIFLYDGDTPHPPSYLSPDAMQANIIMTVIKTIIGEIYHSVGMAGERTKQDNAMGIDNSSGVAKAYDFDRMDALLAGKADQLQVIEERIAHLVDLWGGEKDPGDEADWNLKSEEEIDPLVKYPDSYDVRGLPDEFDIAMNLSLLEAPPAMRQQQMGAIIEKLFPRLAKDLMVKIAADLKQWPPDPMEQAAEMAQITMKTKLATTGGSVTQTPGGGGQQPAGPAPRGKSKQGQNNTGSKQTAPGKS